MAFWTVKAACKKDGERLFIGACSDRTKGNVFQRKEGRFRFSVRNKLFILRLMKHWNKLPGGVVDASSSEEVKIKLGEASYNLIYFLPMAEDLVLYSL